MTTYAAGSLNLFSLKKDVSEALNFDKLDRYEDAYRKYLQCVLRVSSVLLKQLHANEGHVFITGEHQKMVKLGQQCMDRVAELVNEKFERVKESSLPAPESLPLTSDSFRSRSRSTPTTPNAPPTSLVPQITSPDFASVVSSFNTASRTLSEQSSISSNEEDVFSSTKKSATRKLSPMELAARQNQQLLFAFKKRQAQSRNRNTSTNLGLTLQRKMAENLAIAKAQEKVLAKKMKERQARLEEQAVRRFHAPMGLSEDEQHQRQVYKKVLEFEQENSWLVESRKAFENSPQDITVISELIVSVLRCDAHPLTQELQVLQSRLLDQITSLVSSKIQHIKNIKVPLDKQVLDNANLSLHKSSFHHSKSGLRLSRSEAVLSDISDEGVCHSNNVSESSDLDESGKEKVNKSKKDDRHKIKSETDIVCATESLQEDISDAIHKGESLKHKLEVENMKVKTLTRQITEDYEKYNRDNFDDLFDDDDDDDEVGGADGGGGGDDKQDCDNTVPDLQSKEEPKDSVAILQSENKDSDVDLQPGDKESEDDLQMEEKKSDSDLQRKSSSDSLDNKINLLKNEAYHRHLKGISDEILLCIEKIQVLFVIVYEQLDSAEGRDQCNVLLEDYFFRPLWENLLILFRLANEPKEVSLAYIMTVTRDSSPKRFGVREKLCLHGDVSGDFPYQPAVSELKVVAQCHTMLSKLDCLVKSSKQVMNCVEHYFKERNQEAPGIGADDLIPILCYIISKTCLPQLVSECHAMDRFIHEGYIMGEEGYCLTSFQTAINFLISEGIALLGS